MFILVTITGRFVLWTQFRLRMTLLCSVDLMFYVLLTFAWCYFFGKFFLLNIQKKKHFWFVWKVPWYIGYLTDGYFGVVGIWGTFIRKNYLRPDSQMLMGTIQVTKIIRKSFFKQEFSSYILVIFLCISIDILFKFIMFLSL